ncbi:MAG: 8-oxo-dGTP diphosphatase [Glaciecola sp. HTCC2999]|jgi:8-oxo-dGTP diphosphatase|nr:MAG: 8-oxo-dGTP diphosphatase [Glaciecola sp. HTCC2999]
MSDKVVRVAVGVILNVTPTSSVPQVYLTRRASDAHQAGKWEFPGGKVEPGETVAYALERELFEEVGIAVTGSEHLMDIKHDYGDKLVWLDIHLVTHYQHEPFGKEGQIGQWYSLETLHTLDFPAANTAIVAALESRYLP